MVGDLILHVIHVSGKRMIAQGTEGGSRGDLNQGVIIGESMLKYVPLHLSAAERRSEVLSWIRNLWSPAWGELEHLSPEGWFTEGHRALGACEELPVWRLWIGNCAVCGETMKEGEGNFCANFCAGRGSFPP